MRLRYWDANAFLAVLMAEPGRVEKCQPVIHEAEAGRLQIVTSALTIAEVLWLRGQPKISTDRAELVERFFAHEYIVLSEVDRFIAEEARTLVWEHSIKPKDAIHVASALNAGVEQLDTFDEPLIAKSESVGRPPLVIGKPNLPESLFDPSSPSDGS